MKKKLLIIADRKERKREAKRRYREKNRTTLLEKHREYNRVNAKKIQVNNKLHRIKMKAEASRYVNSLKNRPCTDCHGWFEPFQMHFDHRDPEQKVLSVSARVGCGHTIATIKKEIDLCDLVCANCHALRTREQIIAGVFRGK